MKKIGNQYYAKVDVHQYYSFMVVSNIDMTDNDILNESLKKDLFEENNDVDYAEVDTFIDEYDVNSFSSCNSLYNIS